MEYIEKNLKYMHVHGIYYAIIFTVSGELQPCMGKDMQITQHNINVCMCSKLPHSIAVHVLSVVKDYKNSIIHKINEK